MIINGGAAGNVGWWSSHLMREDTNTRAEVVEISGCLAEDLPTALKEMQAIAGQSRSRGNFMYQANLNPEAHEHLTPEQWTEAIDTLEKNLGMEGHQRVVIEHEKEGRTHRHVIWNRVDVDTLRVADIGGNYYTHERTAREIEGRFDLSPTPSPHGGALRPDGRADRAPELWEIRAAERSGIQPPDVKADLTAAWQQTDSGKAFAAAIEEKGYILARGDRRDFVAIDQSGTAHSLARRIDGAKAADVRERMADIDRDSLPSVADAREEQRARGQDERTTPATLPAIDSAPALDAGTMKEAQQAETRAERAEAREDQQAAVQQAWSEKRTAEVERVSADRAPDPVDTGLRVMDGASGAVEKLGDFVLDLLGGATARPAPSAADINQADQAQAQRKALAALERIADSMARGDTLSATDVGNLTPTHLQNIARHGDDYMRNLIERMEYERASWREDDRERYRER